MQARGQQEAAQPDSSITSPLAGHLPDSSRRHYLLPDVTCCADEFLTGNFNFRPFGSSTYSKIYERTPTKLKQAHFCFLTSYNYSSEQGSTPCVYAASVPHCIYMPRIMSMVHLSAGNDCTILLKHRMCWEAIRISYSESPGSNPHSNLIASRS